MTDSSRVHLHTDCTEWHRYAAADENLFQDRGLRGAKAFRAWSEARCRAVEARRRFRTNSAMAIARRLGIRVQITKWETASWKVIHFGESTLAPPVIRINAAAIQWLSEFMRNRGTAETEGWFDKERMTEITAAHELYHVWLRSTGGRIAESAAHLFARTLLGLAYSTLAYERSAREAARWATQCAGRHGSPILMGKDSSKDAVLAFHGWP